jgi:hypothetical protein
LIAFNGPFRFFVAEHLATPFPFISRSTAYKQYHKYNHMFFCANQVNQWPCIISMKQLDNKLANLHKTVSTGKVHWYEVCINCVFTYSLLKCLQNWWQNEFKKYFGKSIFLTVTRQ